MISRINYKNKVLFKFTALLTVITLIFYLFLFSLPHDLHCSKDSDSSVFTNFIEAIEKSHHEDFSKDSNNKEDSKQRHNQDNCPICNLSYFNGLYACELSIQPINLQATTEKPIYKIQTGFSSFTYLKFFLRSPPSYIS